jgi:hypothetical protein
MATEVVNSSSSLKKEETQDPKECLADGCRAPVLMSGMSPHDDWPIAEILSKQVVNGQRKYYVHYVDYNKRLDEWVSEDRIDATKVFFPKKESKHLKNTSSRPASPDASDLPWPACNLKKNISIARKRKLEAANNIVQEVRKEC